MINMTIAGNVGKDAETKTLQSGKVVSNFSVAVSKGKDSTIWIDCALWGYKDGEPHPVAAYITKGSKIALSGEPTVRAYDKGGEPVGVLGMTVREVTLLGKGEASTPAASPTAEPANKPLDSQDLPF